MLDPKTSNTRIFLENLRFELGFSKLCALLKLNFHSDSFAWVVYLLRIGTDWKFLLVKLLIELMQIGPR